MKCKNCGWENPQEAKNCVICGAELLISQDFKPYPPRKKGKKKFEIIKREKVIFEKEKFFLRKTIKRTIIGINFFKVIILGFIPSLLQSIYKRKSAKYFYYALLFLFLFFFITLKIKLNNLFLFLLIIFSIISSFDSAIYYLKKMGYKLKLKNFVGIALVCFSIFFLLYNLFLLLISPLFLIGKVRDDYRYIFRKNDRVLISRLSYYSKEPEKGDIIFIKHPQYGSTIERLFGKPGDFVELKKGKIYINEKELPKNFLPLNNIPNFEFSKKLGENEFCALIYRIYYNDLVILNRDMLIGKIKAILFPPERRKILK